MTALIPSSAVTDARRVVELWAAKGDVTDESLDELLTLAVRVSRSVVDADDRDRARPMICEHRPERGSSMMCALDAGHYPAEPHSDLVVMWNDKGQAVNPDGSLLR